MPCPPLGLPCAQAATDDYASGWELDAIGTPAAWAIGLSGEGIAVGDLDAGYLSEHPALSGANFHPVSHTLDLDGQTQVFDPTLILSDPDEDEYSTHGAKTSGIMAASPDPTVRYRGGVAQDAEVYYASFEAAPAKSTNILDTTDVVFPPQNQAILVSGFQSLMAASPNLKAINNSWNINPFGNTPADVDASYAKAAANGTALFDALHQAANRDILLAFAAGNENTQQPGLMAALPRYLPELTDHYLSVVALDNTGALASYSNACGVSKDWCLAAPGDMYKPDTLNAPSDGPILYGYTRGSGTSYATPLVTGSAALLAERFPYMSMSQIRGVMLTTATQMGTQRVDDTYGWGALNLAKAIHGPDQLLGDQTYTLDAKASGWAINDTWSNNIVAGGRLTKAGTGSLTLAGKTNSFGGVTVNGGTLVLSRANTFTRASEVNEGELRVNGSLTGPSLNVTQAGTLSGTGRINAPTDVSGTLAPGYDGGTLTFTQALALNEESTTRIDSNGKILMSGPQAIAQLAGTLVVEDSGPGNLLTTKDGGSYSGGFDELQQAPELLAHGLRYDLVFSAHAIKLGVNDVELPGQDSLRRNSLDGAELLNALRDEPTLALRNSGYNQWLQGALATGNLGGLERKIGGQVHADAFAYLGHAPQQLQQSLRNQLAQTNAEVGGTQLWVNGLDDNLTHDGANGIAGSKDNTSGLQAGLSRTLSEQLALSGGLSQSKGKVRTAGDSVDIDLTYLSLGTRYAFESLAGGPFVGGQIGVGYLDYSSKRKLGSLGTAKGGSNGWMNNAAVNGGYRWKLDEWYVESQAGLQITRLSLDNFHEKNSEVNLNVKQANHDYSSALFDVKAGRSLQLNNWVISPSATLGYERALNDGLGESKASSNLGYSLEQKAAWQGKDLFKAGLSLDATYGDWGINAGVQGITGSGTSGGGANLQVNYQF